MSKVSPQWSLRLPKSSPSFSVALVEDSAGIVVSGDHEGAVTLWSPATLRPLWRKTLCQGPILGLLGSSMGKKEKDSAQPEAQEPGFILYLQPKSGPVSKWSVQTGSAGAFEVANLWTSQTGSSMTFAKMQKIRLPAPGPECRGCDERLSKGAEMKNTAEKGVEVLLVPSHEGLKYLCANCGEEWTCSHEDKSLSFPPAPRAERGAVMGVFGWNPPLEPFPDVQWPLALVVYENGCIEALQFTCAAEELTTQVVGDLTFSHLKKGQGCTPPSPTCLEVAADQVWVGWTDGVIRRAQLLVSEGSGMELRELRPLWFEQLESGVGCLTFSPNLRLCVVGLWDGQLLFVDVKSTRCLGFVPAHLGSVSSLEFREGWGSGLGSDCSDLLGLRQLLVSSSVDGRISGWML